MKLLLHVKIPGEPIAQERHRWGKGRIYDPKAREKKTFAWQVKAACPGLVPTDKLCGLILEIWSTTRRRQDWDNFGKFYSDACTGTVWIDDAQVLDARVIVHRGALEGSTELTIWEIGTIAR